MHWHAATELSNEQAGTSHCIGIKVLCPPLLVNKSICLNYLIQENKLSYQNQTRIFPRGRGEGEGGWGIKIPNIDILVY